MGAWTNATGLPRTASTRGMLRPVETERTAGLRRDYPVSPELEPFVERYWSVRWDRTGQPAYRSEVLSHPTVNLSVESGTEPRFGVRLPAALVHGVVTRRFCVDLVGAGRVSAAKFRPGGFAAMTGRQPARDTVTPLTNELGLDARQLTADVLDTAGDAERAAILDAALRPLAGEPPAAYLHLLHVLVEMVDDRSLVRVEQVAERGALSVRSLQRLFAGYVGVSPKRVLARYRLQDAAAAMDAGEVEDLAALAAELGWFDQAHFCRDFRAVVGTTPSAYRQRAAVSSKR